MQNTAILIGSIISTDKMKKIYSLALLIILASCSHYDGPAPDSFNCFIYPDYVGVTIPTGIAPLNFDYTSPDAASANTTFSAGGMSVSFSGGKVRWKEGKWRKILDAAAGGDILVHSTVPDTTWTIHVSEDPIDYAIDYRLIAPGYEVWSKMGIYERELASFKERAIIENTDFEGCVNCHEFNRNDPKNFSMHIRGPHGATLIRNNGDLAAYDTKTDSTLAACVYPYWHPSGNFIIYSTNNTEQSFHLQADNMIEVFDTASDLQVYDLRSGEILTEPQIKTEEYWETFPTFSPDGETIYFTRALEQPIPEGLTETRYNLCRTSFDPATRDIGDDIEILVDAASDGKSISFPRPSYDGRYVMYVLSDYGQFSIWHHEAELWLLDLATGENRKLDEVNSPETESFHNWSSNSRWFLFVSRRDDGLFSRVYFAHIDEEGNIGKPFMLPQKEPLRYYRKLFRSYNVPTFVTGPLELDKVKVRKVINSPERIPFRYYSNGAESQMLSSE